MASEALKELRAWQRAHASEQDRAFRVAQRALVRLAQLEAERVDAQASLATGVAALETSGVVRDQVAALLDVTPDELGRLLGPARRTPPAGSAR